MKRIHLIVLTFILFLGRLAPAGEAAIKYTALQPEPQHPRVTQLVTQILLRNHYRQLDLNDSLSAQVYNNLLEILDYNKSYFLKSDIESFKPFKYAFDNFLLSGRLDVPFTIFNTFQQRMAERLAFVFKRLETPFDFTKDEYYYPYRDSLDWAGSAAELDEFWRKRLKNEALSLKIAGKDDDNIRETLTKRYGNLKRRLSQNQSEDVVQIYLNALSSCFDPHTSYFSPKAKDDFNIRMSLSLEGIGARLITENDYTKVVEVIPGGPAAKSGLIKADDLIIGVGQGEEGEMVDVIGWRIDDVVQLIRGKKGTKVRLQLLHDPNALLIDAETIVLTRDKIKLEDSAAKADTLHILSRGQSFVYGVIDIPAFYQDFAAQRRGDPNYKSTTRDVRRLIREMQGQGIDGLILDLRGNGGGFLSEADSLTGLFIKQGPVVQVKDSRGRIMQEVDRNPSVYYDGPLAVLVDQFSASASEIFAAAIQDYGRGIIIGSQTFGKGTVQSAADLNRYFPGSKYKYGQLKLTIRKFYRVTGGSTQNRGVMPDVDMPSRFEHDEVGESSRKNALAWDHIAPAPYVPENEVTPETITRLLRQHQIRLTQDSAFAAYAHKVEELRHKKRPQRYSLNLEKRRAERQDKEEDDKKKKKTDWGLLESGRVLSDLILIQKDGGR